MRKTIARRLRCMQEYCRNYGQTWESKPIPVEEGLVHWPQVVCEGCQCFPLFLGYIEEEVPDEESHI